ncbi:hypothetical protein UF75_1426 [Desulfosporosinus sp. I2]|nr:hypothetical protein UF75_1426 [Desulfosporosinus sp. I2]
MDFGRFDYQFRLINTQLVREQVKWHDTCIKDSQYWKYSKKERKMCPGDINGFTNII